MKSNLLNTSRNIINCVVTGFDPFGDNLANPSEKIVRNLPESIEIENKQTVLIEKLVLPTCCEDSWKLLNNRLNELKDNTVVLVMLGLAEERQIISLEKVALNLRDYRIEDNRGHKHNYQKIDDKSENAIFNEMNLDSICQNLNLDGYMTDVSYHAGTFVCNELYFQSLKYKNQNDHLKSSLFVHVPNIVEFEDKTIYKTADEQLDQMLQTVLAIIEKQILLEGTNGSTPA